MNRYVYLLNLSDGTSFKCTVDAVHSIMAISSLLEAYENNCARHLEMVRGIEDIKRVTFEQLGDRPRLVTPQLESLNDVPSLALKVKA